MLRRTLSFGLSDGATARQVLQSEWMGNTGSGEGSENCDFHTEPAHDPSELHDVVDKFT